MLTNTGRWLTRIVVKDTFTDSPTDEDIQNSANVIVLALERIQNRFEKVIDNNFMDFDIVLDNFKFVRDGIENRINYKKYDDLGTWHSWKDVFNEYMEMLYDIADERVNVIGEKGFEDGVYKFIWIE